MIRDFHINVPVESCCGCGACVQKCPRGALKMRATSEGFLEPVRDDTLCMGCHLCERVCPEQQAQIAVEPICCYAAKSGDESVVKKCSSGGVAYEAARLIIEQGGVVFGARFDEDWRVRHDMAETVEELNRFRGSKYVQSDMGDSFRKAKEILKSRRKVLFTGTPCQIAGLHTYLGKADDNLYTLAIFCHGVPSPKLWDSYLQEVLSLQTPKIHPADIESISFRDKEATSGHAEQLSIYLSGGRLLLREGPMFNDYYLAFSSHFALRESCYHCQFRMPHIRADLVVGDFWGLDQAKVQVRNENGINAVMVMTERGRRLFEAMPLQKQEVELASFMPSNYPLYYDPVRPAARALFFQLLGKVSVQKALRRSYLSIHIRDFVQEAKLHKKLYGRYSCFKALLRHFQYILTREQRRAVRKWIGK